MSRRAGIGIALLALLAASASALPAASEQTVVVKGQLIEADGNGTPVAFQTVRLLKTRKIRSLSDRKSQAQEVEEARTRTDASGNFRFEIQADPSFPFWFLRFYDPKEFDTVKYQVPPDHDVSRPVHDGLGAEVRAALVFHRDWPKVKDLVDRYGAASQRGQILRTLGLPTVQPQEDGKELWVYPASGVAYLLEGDKVIETRRGKESAAATAQPAEKVDPQ